MDGTGDDVTVEFLLGSFIHEVADACDDEVEERSDDVPPKATITIKEINDNRYYYWQWREGDRICSEYKGPVNPDE